MIDTEAPDAGTQDAPPAAAAPGTRRPRRRLPWVIMAVVTALVIVVPGGAQLAGGILEQTQRIPTGYTRPVTEVRLDIGDARVSVGPGEEGRVRLREELTWALDKPTVRKSWSGTVLRIQVSCDDSGGPFTGLECGADLDLQVPPGTKLTAASSSGEVVARGLTGGIEFRTNSGALQLTDIQGPVLYRGDSGEIRGEGLGSRTVDARVGSGSIDLAFKAQPDLVSTRAGSGSIDISVPAGTHYRITGKSGSGGRQIDPALDDGVATSRIEASTGQGSVEVGYPRRR